jgi:hypothetical protein
VPKPPVWRLLPKFSIAEAKKKVDRPQLSYYGRVVPERENLNFWRLKDMFDDPGLQLRQAIKLSDEADKRMSDYGPSDCIQILHLLATALKICCRAQHSRNTRKATRNLIRAIVRIFDLGQEQFSSGKVQKDDDLINDLDKLCQRLANKKRPESLVEARLEAQKLIDRLAKNAGITVSFLEVISNV